MENMEGGLGPEVKLPAGISVVGKWHRVGEDFVCSPPHHLAKDRPDAGFGTWLRIKGNKIELEVDRIRSTPVFYAMTPDGQKVCASPTFGEAADWLKEQRVAISMDIGQAASYCLAGYTLGGKTLCPHIKTVMPGCRITLGPGIEQSELAETFHFYEEAAPITLEQAADLIDEATDASVKRFIEFADDRPVAVPLSGGYDSRYLLSKLRRLGCTNVSCYTYGASQTGEVETARKVASALGYPWNYVEYSPEKWKAFRASGRLRDYFDFAISGVSSPHIQDLLAVIELMEIGAISKDSVMMPGHSGDFTTGGHRQNESSRESPEDLVFQRHFVLCGPLDSPSQTLHKTARSALNASSVRTDRDSEDIVEEWNMRQRQAFNIVNSLRVYDYLGLDWGMPMWDREFYDVWRKIPIPMRMGRQAFIYTVNRETKSQLGSVASSFGAHKAWQKRIPRGLRKFLGRNKLIYRMANKAIKKSDPLGWFSLYSDEQWTPFLERARTISHLIACETLLIQCDRYGWEPPIWISEAAIHS